MMATNYAMMKESQSEVLESFINFYESVINNQIKLHKQLKENSLSYEEIYNETCFLEREVNITYTDMLDNCMWIIQKDQPRAGYLRFFIATINSIKDLERISDHAEIISEYFLKSDFDEEQKQFFLECFSYSNEVLLKLFTVFKNKEFNTDIIEEIKTIRSRYMAKTNKALIKVLNDHNNQNWEDNSKQVKLILMFRHIERNIDHGINVIQNFGNIHITSK